MLNDNSGRSNSLIVNCISMPLYDSTSAVMKVVMVSLFNYMPIICGVVLCSPCLGSKEISRAKTRLEKGEGKR